MNFDFNNEAEQRSMNFGPVPDGSEVLLRMELNTPFKAVSQRYPMIGQTNTGLFNLNIKYTVIAGTYTGTYWFDSMLLPSAHQRVQLTENQRKACDIAGANIRGIIEAYRGISPKDKSPAACQKRGFDDWSELNGMEFPARLGINQKPREKDGKVYWKNRISFIITPDEKNYKMLMEGGEVINKNGAVTDPGYAPSKSNNSQYDDPFAPAPTTYQSQKRADPYQDDIGPSFEASPGEVAGMDDIPF